MKAAALVLALAAAWPTAHAEFYSGNELLQRMRADVHSVIVLGYIAGVVDAQRGFLACPPADVSLGQLYEMLRNHLERNAHQRHFSGDVLIAGMTSTIWPCKKS